jgi:hypothetical protein
MSEAAAAKPTVKVWPMRKPACVERDKLALIDTA